MEHNFPILKNDRILKAARGEATDRVPVWVMRQAGRYLPQFREIRQNHDFFQICRTPELASEVTLQPIRAFQLDAAIIFSDILVLPQAFGMSIKMMPDEGPIFASPLSEPQDIKKTLKKKIDVKNDLKYVYDAITLTRHKLDGKVPLIGFAGAPWTLFSYMVQGSGSKTFSKPKKWLYQYPYESIELLQRLADSTIEFLYFQVQAGAQLIQLFESHLGFLTPKLFRQFELPFLKHIGKQLKDKLKNDGLDPVPLIIYGKDGHFSLPDLGDDPNIFDVISLDWTIDPKKARSMIHHSIALQGNLDPCALYSEPDDIDSFVYEMIQEFGRKSYIANLGHGIYPDTNPKNVNTFVNAVHKHSVC